MHSSFEVTDEHTYLELWCFVRHRSCVAQWFKIYKSCVLKTHTHTHIADSGLLRILK